MLPPLAKMRAVVERMRNLSDVIAVRANSSGRLQLSASTEVVKADVTWTNCSHPRIGKCHRPRQCAYALLFTITLFKNKQTNKQTLQLRMEPRRPTGVTKNRDISVNVNDLTQTISLAYLSTLEAS